MPLFKSSVRFYLAATLLAVSVPTGLVAGSLALMAGRDALTSLRVERGVTADRALLGLGTALAAQKIEVAAALEQQDRPADLISAWKARVESAQRAAVSALAATDLAGRDEVTKALDEQWKAASPLYQQVLDEAGKSRAERSMAMAMDWSEALATLAATANAGSAAAATASRLFDAELAQLDAVKDAARKVERAYAEQCPLLRPNVGTSRALWGGLALKLGTARGATAAGLDVLSAFAAAPGARAGLGAKASSALAAVQAATGRADEVIARFDDSGTRLMSGEEWMAQCQAPLPVLADLIAATLEDMRAHAASASQSALAKLAGMAALFLVTIVVGLGSWRGIRSRIVGPLAMLQRTLDRIKAQDFAEPVPAPAFPDELGRLTLALEDYRVSALALEKEHEAQEARREAESRQASILREAVVDVGGVVKAAGEGDFSRRVGTDGLEGPVRELVEGINAINLLFDTATAEFAATLDAMSRGNLSQRIPTAYAGRLATLRDAINETGRRLAEMVATIQATAGDVTEAAGEIMAGAENLSRRTEDQASSLEETAATAEQLAASVKATAQAARQAAHEAEEARAIAQQGGEIVGQAVSAMERIEQASAKIGEISSVIEEIAFQTNLLALNAAVEAARAGDAGKGFAVVASEVRTLAQRSSEAARNIAGLIASANGQVGDGVHLVRGAGKALAGIVEASRKVSATVVEISSATDEQSNGINEMSQAVSHMDEMTQQNAALAEESSASASALAQQIALLDELVAQFTTGEAPARAAPAAPEPVAMLRRAAGRFR